MQLLHSGRNVNRNLRIDTREGRFVLRERIRKGPRPGADPLREVACHRAAAGAGVAASLLLAVVIARFLAAETQAAWPQLDASTMVLSLFATWLTAGGKLENWLYWIVVDAVQAWLYAAQGLVFTAFLFLVYLVIAFVGFIEWSKTYRRQTLG